MKNEKEIKSALELLYEAKKANPNCSIISTQITTLLWVVEN